MLKNNFKLIIGHVRRLVINHQMKSSIFNLKGTGLPVIILPMNRQDIDDVVEIHSEQFPRQKDSIQWVSCNFAAYHGSS